MVEETWLSSLRKYSKSEMVHVIRFLHAKVHDETVVILWKMMLSVEAYEAGGNCE